MRSAWILPLSNTDLEEIVVEGEEVQEDVVEDNEIVGDSIVLWDKTFGGNKNENGYSVK